MLDNLVGGGSQVRRSEITIDEKTETAFVAAKGMGMAHALCTEMGMQAAANTSAPKHYLGRKEKARLPEMENG